MDAPMEFAVIAGDPNLRQSDPAWDRVVSALNMQIAHQAAPTWGKSATVSSYGSAAAVPASATPIVVLKSPPPGVEGCHRWQNNQASAIIRWRAGGAWSVAASHEIIETLADPALAATRPGLDPQGTGASVDCLLEVCDPCAGQTYSIGSNIEVSDFCLPAYYAKDGTAPYTYCKQRLHLWELGSQVSAAGYVTWSTGAGWFQLMDGSIRGPFSKDELLANSLKLGLRGAVDRYKLFGKPPHLRPKARGGTRPGKTSSRRQKPKNGALEAWIRTVQRRS
jgi:hypothetical protein